MVTFVCLVLSLQERFRSGAMTDPPPGVWRLPASDDDSGWMQAKQIWYKEWHQEASGDWWFTWEERGEFSRPMPGCRWDPRHGERPFSVFDASAIAVKPAPGVSLTGASSSFVPGERGIAHPPISVNRDFYP